MQTPTTALSVVLNDTLANLTAGAPYAAVYRGHYAAVSDNSALYWIDATGALQLVNFNVAGYTGFTFTDGTTSSANISSGGTVTFADGAGIDVVSDGASTLTVALAGAAGATAGQTLVADGSGGVAFAAPLTVAAASAGFASINGSNELEISQLLVSDVTTDGTSADLATFVGASYTAGTEFQEGDVVILTAPTGGTETYIHNGGSAGTAADFTQIGNPAGAVQNFNVAGDSGGPITVADGNTVTISGGANVVTAITGNTVDIDLVGAISEIAAVAKPGAAGTYMLQYDQAGDAYTYVDASSFDTSLANADQTLTGARSVTQAANALTFAATGGNVIMNGGDLEIDTNGKGLIQKSPNGTRYRLSVNDIGVATFNVA